MACGAQHSRPPPISVSTILYLHSSHMKPLAAFQSTLSLCSVSLLFAITHYLPSVSFSAWWPFCRDGLFHEVIQEFPHRVAPFLFHVSIVFYCIIYSLHHHLHHMMNFLSVSGPVGCGCLQGKGCVYCHSISSVHTKPGIDQSWVNIHCACILWIWKIFETEWENLWE